MDLETHKTLNAVEDVVTLSWHLTSELLDFVDERIVLMTYDESHTPYGRALVRVRLILEKYRAGARDLSNGSLRQEFREVRV